MDGEYAKRDNASNTKGLSWGWGCADNKLAKRDFVPPHDSEAEWLVELVTGATKDETRCEELATAYSQSALHAYVVQVCTSSIPVRCLIFPRVFFGLSLQCTHVHASAGSTPLHSSCPLLSF